MIYHDKLLQDAIYDIDFYVNYLHLDWFDEFDEFDEFGDPKKIMKPSLNFLNEDYHKDIVNPYGFDSIDHQQHSTDMTNHTTRSSNDMTFSVYAHFQSLYKHSPHHNCRMSFESGYDASTMMDTIKKSVINDFKHMSKTYEAARMFETEDKHGQVNCHYMFHKTLPVCLVWMFNEDSSDHKLHVSCADDPDALVMYEDIKAKTKAIYSTLVKPLREDANKFAIICRTNDGFYLEHFDVRKVDDGVLNHYNPDFQQVHDCILKNLNELNKNGLVLLHGDPGTGKTTYLRYLIGQLKKNPIYMPPDLAHYISSPDFVMFLSKQPNSVLIIEDAENILMSRESGGNQAVSNLLNVTSGLLGDALQMQIVATFNTPYEDIDHALKRPGRLIAEYRFNPLNESKTMQLVKELHGLDAVPKKPCMTLAEIYTMNDELHIASEKKAVGFM